MTDKLKAIQVIERLSNKQRPRIRIKFYPDRIEFRVMSKDRMGMSASWIACYRRAQWYYNEYLIKQTFK